MTSSSDSSTSKFCRCSSKTWWPTNSSRMAVHNFNLPNSSSIWCIKAKHAKVTSTSCLATQMFKMLQSRTVTRCRGTRVLLVRACLRTRLASNSRSLITATCVRTVTQTFKCSTARVLIASPRQPNPFIRVEAAQAKTTSRSLMAWIDHQLWCALWSTPCTGQDLLISTTWCNPLVLSRYTDRMSVDSTPCADTIIARTSSRIMASIIRRPTPTMPSPPTTPRVPMVRRTPALITRKERTRLAITSLST